MHPGTQHRREPSQAAFGQQPTEAQGKQWTGDDQKNRNEAPSADSHHHGHQEAHTQRGPGQLALARWRAQSMDDPACRTC